MLLSIYLSYMLIDLYIKVKFIYIFHIYTYIIHDYCNMYLILSYICNILHCTIYYSSLLYIYYMHMCCYVISVKEHLYIYILFIIAISKVTTS